MCVARMLRIFVCNDRERITSDDFYSHHCWTMRNVAKTAAPAAGYERLAQESFGNIVSILSFADDEIASVGEVWCRLVSAYLCDMHR